VIEPSRLQSAITQDLLTQAGGGKVEVARSAAEALNLLQSWQPAVIWTAMELPDVRGLTMLQTLARRGSLKHTTVVVNSGDCTVSDLSRIEHVGCITLAPKSSRRDVAIRVLHAAGLITADAGMVRRNIDPSSVPVRLISDSRTVPDALLALLNEVQLRHLDVMSTVRSAIMVPPASSVSTLTSTNSGVPRTAAPLLTILIRSAATLPGDATVYSSMVSMRRSELAAAIQNSAEGLVLRAVGCIGVTALLRRNVDLKTIQQLVQASSQ
jgi:CheY-like chemotaxis protein